MKNKIQYILIQTIPIWIMMGLIPLIEDDYLLTLAYIIVISISFWIKKMKGEILVFFLGFFAMIVAETVFVSTGVETFIRNSLFGLMPIWLPFLWGYSFVSMKRAIKILEL